MTFCGSLALAPHSDRNFLAFRTGLAVPYARIGAGDIQLNIRH